MLAQVRPWLSGTVFCSQALLMLHEWGWVRPHSVWPFTFVTPPPLAWQGPSILVQSVKEMEDPGGMAGTVWLEERLSVCERLLRLICSTHAGSGLCVCDGECHWCHCVPFSVVQAVLYYWHCLWTFSGQSKLGGWHPWGTGWCSCGCVLALLPIYWNAHF